MAIVNRQITTATLDIFDPVSSLGVPVGKSYAITNILVCNTGAAAATFDMHLIPNGDPRWEIFYLDFYAENHKIQIHRIRLRYLHRIKIQLKMNPKMNPKMNLTLR